MKFFEGLLSSDGKTSSTRVSMFACIIAAILYAFFGLYILSSSPNSSLSLFEVNSMVGTFLVAGFTGKGVGSFFEAKRDKQAETVPK